MLCLNALKSRNGFYLSLLIFILEREKANAILFDSLKIQYFFFLFFILFSFLCTDIKKRKEGKKNWENFDLFSSSNIPLDYCECESSFCPTWITAIWNLIYFRFIFIFNGLKKHLNKRTRTHWQQKKRKKILLVRCVDQHYWIYTTKRFHQRRLFTWGAQYSKQTDETILKKTLDIKKIYIWTK